MDSLFSRGRKRVFSAASTRNDVVLSLPPSWRDALVEGERRRQKKSLDSSEERPSAPEVCLVCHGFRHVRPAESPRIEPALLRRTILHPSPPAFMSAICVDLETTGFSAQRDDIVSIGAVELRWDGTTLQQWVLGARSFFRTVRPSKPSSHQAEAVHGLSFEMLRDAPPLEDVISDFAAFLIQLDGNLPQSGQTEENHRAKPGDLSAKKRCTAATTAGCVLTLPPVIAHNANFDASFLQRAVSGAGWRVVWDEYAPLTCTQSMFRALYSHQAADLSRACQFCGVDTSGRDERHDALHDAQLCGRLFLRLAEKWPFRR
ncbi:hypothetical protein ECC02_004037 [Trypanosoma cruzi]|uniref:Exonuclease domain-containing protein n=1 Tax=Trypanosoma cruzi TaxID=5693 RepID=A0A7J6Y865_TRYCR|nr:hypothetical protein ECC02_004037 [Trypanosoma cruzi]